jgi:hypothetical protein
MENGIATADRAVINLSERLTAFRRRIEELPAEVAEFLDRLGRIAEAEPQGGIARQRRAPKTVLSEVQLV